MFERMEILEAIYKGVEPSKNNQRADANRARFGRKQKGGGAVLLSNP